MGKHLYILFFFCIIYIGTQAQLAQFVLIPSSVSTQIKGKANDSLSLFYKCIYLDTISKTPFTGVVYTYYNTNKNNKPSIARDSFNTDSVPIHNGDTVWLFCHIPVDKKYFSNGKSNLIIIWPTGARQATKAIVECSDSFHYATNVAISGLSGIDVNGGAFGEVGIYPNPTNGILNINNNNPYLVIKQERIFDYTGREVLKVQGGTGKIDLSAVKSGTYFLELSSEDGETAVYTFVISR